MGGEQRKIDVDKMSVAELESLGYREGLALQQCAEQIQQLRARAQAHKQNFDAITAAIVAKNKKAVEAVHTDTVAKPNRAQRRQRK